MTKQWQQNDWKYGGQDENILGEAELFTLKIDNKSEHGDREDNPSVAT